MPFECGTMKKLNHKAYCCLISLLVKRFCGFKPRIESNDLSSLPLGALSFYT